MRYVRLTKFLSIAICFFNTAISSLWVRSAQTQDLQKKIQQAIHDFVNQNLQVPHGELLIEFHPFNDSFMNGSITGEVKILPKENKIHKGNQILKCGIFQQGQLIETFNCRVNIQTYQTIVVSNKPISLHTILEKEDLILERRETTKISKKFYTSMDELLGSRTKRFIQTGEIILENMVEPMPVITRGKQVNIRFMKGALEIVLPGLARQDGYVGEKIRVRCLKTNKNFKAKIVDPNTVIVNLL